ncbi:hypothetical protein Murru_0318 [Allomuricauda ruestringensis DSM 13258]|uniref:Adhesin domain-containing protein n=1 Tax=Allomuricauda ruestringensis (strain DSM 13258 / CIP 107369 / LMG 19739 / B1) TaxID=886377 RepID=G2PSB7_ALLRU|nr:hypothetical protein [Allomuricauda ruestringensis]AEM69374.1 hypothetical protein Murru_0318 [Allomuricauda ruestringensis DSM 13258]
MSRNHQILFSGLLLALVGFTGQAQEKSKTYKENFNVNKDTELNINTSYADIQFETWDKDQVEITAVIELEGVDKEEADAYFERDLVKIMGNSKEIEVSTEGAGPNYTFDFQGFNIDIPEMPSVAEIIANVEIPEIPEFTIPEINVMPSMPPMPPMPPIEFDYDAYKKDGDKYMKEWKKEFDKTFDKEYKARFEEWGKRMEEMAEEREARREEMREERDKLREEREKVREEMHEQLRQQREELRTQQAELREEQTELRKQLREEARTIHGSPNVFYFSSDGEHKEYKVKKRIIIKMPKYIKLNLNVRHGEVKLAENTKNINASLSYASLLASTIDGDKTDIRVSYSPVVVQNWNYGSLSTDYSDKVNLKEVKELKLHSVSSNVVIGSIANRATVTNNFGVLSIDEVSDGFSTIDISMENGELDCKLPKTPYTISVSETTSGFQYPKALQLTSTQKNGANIHTGYHISKNDGKTIKINSKYSEVVLKN